MHHGTTSTLTLLTGALACCLAGCGGPIDEDEGPPEAITQAGHLKGARRARAVVKDAAGAVLARLSFRAQYDGTTSVSVSATLAAAQAGFHGMHVHANDNPANGAGCIADPAQPPATHFVSADGHLTLPNRPHGAHAGDMPSLLVMGSGRGSLEFLTDRFLVSDLIGRAVIVHQGADNFGNVPVGAAANQYTPNAPDATALTEATGNAGPRLGCGVIE
jgi:Cu-Zn family superoxide dismutase